ncbi:MAG: hypothetical protein GXP11_06285 [Gammaproteobacteria bacterium]|nr:hypothetical protein [Gammaproteobacteria bacterium]
MLFKRILRLGYVKVLLVLMVPLVACGGSGSSDGDSAGVGSVMLSWTAPSERADATRIDPTAIAGYNVYYKTATGGYGDQVPIYIDDSNNVENVQVRLEGILIQPGAYFVVVTTVDVDGLESVFSTPEVEVIF